MRRAVARSAHHIPERQPIKLNVGDRVEVGRRDDEWPAFVFVTTRGGSGWVPERHVERDGSIAVVRTAYDTTELPTEEGDELEVAREDQDSGWSWCRASNGRAGWVPDRTLSFRRVRGARIFLWPVDGEQEIALVTDAWGRLRYPLAPGEYRLHLDEAAEQRFEVRDGWGTVRIQLP